MKNEPVNCELSQQQLENELMRVEHRRKRAGALKNTVLWLLIAAASMATVSVLWFPVLWIPGGNGQSPERGQLVLTMRSATYALGDLVGRFYGDDAVIQRVAGVSGDRIIRDDQGSIILAGKKISGDRIPDDLSSVPEEETLLIDLSGEKLFCVPRAEIVGRVVLRIWPLPWDQ